MLATKSDGGDLRIKMIWRVADPFVRNDSFALIPGTNEK